MALFEWKNGTKTQNAIVTGDGVTVQDAIWEGETPISASNMNVAQEQLQNEVETNINTNLGTETDTWSSSSSYNAGDIVIYDGGLYQNRTGENSSAPNTDTTNWLFVSIKDYLDNKVQEIYDYIDRNTRRMYEYVEIPDNTNINTYVQTGTYKSLTSAHSATMSGIPSEINGGFTLYVTTYTSTSSSTTYRRQEIIQGNNTYIRTTSNGGSTWGSWNKITTSTVPTKS